MLFICKTSACAKFLMSILHFRKLKPNEQKSAKRMISKVSYVCGSILFEYLGTRNDRDEKYLKNIFVRANISCSSKIELPYFTVDFYPKVCIYCGVTGTSRTLGNSVEHYPKCLKCAGKPDVVRRKRKALVAADLSKKRNERC